MDDQSSQAGVAAPVVRSSDLLAPARLDEVEVEFRAQVEAVIGAGLSPTHLDWHCLADGAAQRVSHRPLFP